MRRAFIIMLLILTVTQAGAQDLTAVEQRVEVLRQQLREVNDRRTQLQARGQQLDEALRPENIERSVAGIGTTDAAALRDRRRQQLEREKATVDEQLQSLDASRTRLEASIASAEAEAVRLRSAPPPEANNSSPQEQGSATSTPTLSASPREPKQRRGVKRRKRARAPRRGSSR